MPKRKFAKSRNNLQDYNRRRKADKKNGTDVTETSNVPSTTTSNVDHQPSANNNDVVASMNVPPVVDNGVRIPPAVDNRQVIMLYGTVHQSSPGISAVSSGRMCTACSLISLCVASHIPPRDWNTQTVDNIIKVGDLFYNRALAIRRGYNPAEGNPYLASDEVTHEGNNVFTIAEYGMGYRCSEDITLMKQGHLRQRNGEMAPLVDGLISFFSQADRGFIVCGCQTMAIMRITDSEGATEYCLVDSHSRPGFRGGIDSNAFLMRCPTLETLTEALLEIFQHRQDSEYYTLNAIVIQHDSEERLPAPDNSFRFSSSPFVRPYNTRRSSATRRSASINLTPRTTTTANSSHLGAMTSTCDHCGALKFPQETDFSCCKKGQIDLPITQDYPEFLQALLTGDHPLSKHFVANIRAYNSTVAMASVAAKYDAPSGRGPPIIKISGIFHHRIADVTRNNPQFGSVYICSGESDESCNNPSLNRHVLAEIRSLLRQRNTFVQVYKQMGDKIDSSDPESIPNLHINFFLNPSVDRRRYNAPTDPNEIGAVFFSGDGQVPPLEDNCLQVYYLDNSPERIAANVETRTISKISPISDPLCYPILFPNGELGWSCNLQLNNARKRTNISMREYYVYRMQIRENEFNSLFYAGRLTQQFVVDTYVKIEGSRLSYIRNNQQKMRAESYDGVLDYYRRRVDNDEHREVGRVVILPSSFQGGHRYMIGCYQDSMAMVAKFGKPTFFITMTCNPRWTEVTSNLKRNQISSDRPDLIVRVFKQKLKMLMADLTKKSIFGKITSWVYVIEFQKRGLPHAHISITVDETVAPKSADQVDRYISCELPDIDADRELYNLVLELMVHGPCGSLNPNAPCMEDGECKKKFPQAFTDQTVLREGMVTYRRRNTGIVVPFKRHNVDNSWIIPYNPYLLARYGCHINVLFVANVGCIKYLYKYITKGHDAALFRVEDEATRADGVVFDEIAQFIESRYVSACESMWRVYGISMFEKSHVVVRLPIHLPNERTVYFPETDDPDVIMNAADNSASLLEEYFALNDRDEQARSLHYVEIPEHYVFRNMAWHRRQRKINVLGRLYTISPKYVEKFHLRVLLLHVKGAVSFQDLLDPRDNGPPCSTFREAATRRMLIGGDDHEWHRTLQDAIDTQVPGQVRKVFCYLLNGSDILDPLLLYTTYRKEFMDDYRRRGLSESESEKRALSRIERFLSHFNNSLRNYGFSDLLTLHGVNEANHLEDDDNDDAERMDTHSEDHVLELEALRRILLITEVEECVSQFNAEQHEVYRQIVDSIEPFCTGTAKCFYLQGAGGTGKTFVYNVLLKRMEALGIPFLAVAHTGIAALLLHKGRTAHSTFRLPLDVHEDSTSSITRNSSVGQCLTHVKLIVWDEISMTNHFTVNTVDRLLRDLHADENTPFGGVCMLFGGDLRQLLPVNRGSAVQLEHTFLNCRAWPYFRIMELTENMRADRDALHFANWLLQLGNGTLKPDDSVRHLLPAQSIEVPTECISNDVVEDIYGEIFEMSEEDRLAALAEKMVLCSLNQTCDTINERMVERFPGEPVVILSNDSIETDDINDKIKYQEEVLNTRNHSALPKHVLTLKKGVPVILLRNISMEDGLVNGTRMVVRTVTQFLLTGEIICGPRKGELHTIPRLDLSSRDSHFPFTLKRRQFPVKVCFAMTINKAQGQSFKRIGIYLPQPVFAFGQLYVAFSRSRNFQSVRVQVEKTTVQGKLITGDQRIFTRNLAPVELLQRLFRQQQQQHHSN